MFTLQEMLEINVGSEVHTEMKMKMAVFWDAVSRNLLDTGRLHDAKSQKTAIFRWYTW
jgi:hypothetical protein